MTAQQILKNSKLSPLDTEILLSYTLKKPKEYLIAHPETKLTASQIARFKKLTKRRLSNEPIAYLTGNKEFFGRDFFVDRNVLIPRPETELLVEASLQRIMNYELACLPTRQGIMNIIDVGTGSGNIVISIAKNVPVAMRNNIIFYAIDFSLKALEIAKKNAKRHRINGCIKFIQSDLLEFFVKKKEKLWENTLIVANLPYVSPALYKKHQNGLRFEPKTALISQKNGLGHYLRLLKSIRNICTEKKSSNIGILMEISPEQKDDLGKIIKNALPKAKVDFEKDLAGKWRMADIRIS